MSEVVLDASVVTDLLIGVGQVDRLVEMSAQRWHAPAHLDVEVTSALRGLVLGGHLSPSRAVDALIDLADLDIRRWPMDLASARRVLALRETMTAYDAAYVVCAEGVDGSLVTRDRRLARACADLVDTVVL
jgi:predicted nucleic acid-binding protein